MGRLIEMSNTKWKRKKKERQGKGVAKREEWMAGENEREKNAGVSKS